MENPCLVSPAGKQWRESPLELVGFEVQSIPKLIHILEGKCQPTKRTFFRKKAAVKKYVKCRNLSAEIVLLDISHIWLYFEGGQWTCRQRDCLTNCSILSAGFRMQDEIMVCGMFHNQPSTSLHVTFSDRAKQRFPHPVWCSCRPLRGNSRHF